MFYALLEKHLDEMLPIVYTPTVGAAVQQFSALYQNPRGLSFSPLNIDRAAQTRRNGCNARPRARPGIFGQ